MSYRETELPPRSGPSKVISWILVVFGAASIAFLTWHQIVMDSVSKRYGIQVRPLSELLWLLAFVGLESCALYAAIRRHYGLAAGLSGFVVILLGTAVLFALAAT